MCALLIKKHYNNKYKSHAKVSRNIITATIKVHKQA